MYGKEYKILSYNQIESDFHEQIVRECRGLILDSKNNPVVIPFFKFGNYGENYVPEIDWSSACVCEKLDGSIIKVALVDGKIIVSTNGTINAEKAMVNDMELSFYELFRRALENNGLSISALAKSIKPNYTYMFELTSPYNRVIVCYKEIDARLIGIRNNITFEEENIYESEDLIEILRPKSYKFSSIEDCVKNAQSLPHQEEGYVVFDKFYNRVKIKSPHWVALHHLRGDGVVTKTRIIELLKVNEDSEFLSYFPEYSEVFESVKSEVADICKKLDKELKEYRKCEKSIESRKDKALYIQKNFTNEYFGYVNINQEIDAKTWLISLRTEVIKDVLDKSKPKKEKR